jgi:hypothetical protein
MTLPPSREPQIVSTLFRTNALRDAQEAEGAGVRVVRP